MRLEDLLVGVPVVHVDGVVDREVTHVTRDSRDVSARSVFVAIRGATVDGHRFTGELDAAAVVVERGEVATRPGVTRIVVEDTRAALAALAASLHGWPGRRVPVVGVTGTNGKTTITTILEEGLRSIGLRAGRVGTTGTSVNGQVRAGSLTTPEATTLQALLAEMEGFDAVTMEVSSIGLDQRRVDGIPFHLAVFTNLGQDHLDFHGTMERYAASKSRLFSELLRDAGGAPRALVCIDDGWWTEMHVPGDRWTYGFAEGADLRIDELATAEGWSVFSVTTPRGRATIRSRLLGRHNAQNLTAALGACLALGLSLEQAVSAVSAVEQVGGRLQPVPNGHGITVLVDYAHTPDALEAALVACREAAGDGAVWVVFGCGGDRDRTKRSVMGEVASQHADRIVVTSDNPRSEDPLRIIEDILEGVAGTPHVEADRRVAIHHAVRHAVPGDVVLLAGKGHETTQEIQGKKLPFDDLAIAHSALGER